jgi:pimeloyl-ACP methyl ester carboxylesterase
MSETIVLVHGLWMTPRSWEEWVTRYQQQGHRVLAPAYPGFEIEVEALRENPQVIAEQTVPEIVDHLEGVIKTLDRAPIIMGHSFGGTLTQLLLARGNGACAVVIDSAPTEGVHVNPPSQIKSLFPILNNPAKRNQAVGFTAEQFHYAFTNTLSEEESLEVYERYHIPAPGSFVWKYGLLANLTPGHQETWVDYHNDARAPLLFIAGGADHIMPASVNKSNAKHYKSGAITEFHEFPGRSHWTCGEPGWEEVADYALSWALQHTSAD